MDDGGVKGDNVAKEAESEVSWSQRCTLNLPVEAVAGRKGAVKGESGEEVARERARLSAIGRGETGNG